MQKPTGTPLPQAAPVKPAPADPNKVFARPTANLDSAFSQLEKASSPPAEARPAGDSGAQAKPPTPDKADKPAAQPGPPRPDPKDAAQPKEPDGSQKEEMQVEDDFLGLAEKADPAEEAPAATEEKPRVATLRQMYDQTKAENAKLARELAEIKKAGRGPDAPEFAQLQEQLKAASAEREQLLNALKSVDYTRHPEFKEKFEKPYERAYQMGREFVSQLKLRDPQTGNDRPATAQDFDQLMTLHASDPDRGAEALDALFGPKAASVAAYMTRVHEAIMNLNEARRGAMQQGDQAMQERSKQMAQAQQEVTSQIETHWKKYADGAKERFPQFFAPVEGDEAGNAALQKGFEQSAFALSNLNPGDLRLTPQQREAVVKAHAAVFNKAAAFNRMAVWLKQRDARIKELEADLEKFKESEPKGGEGAGGKMVAGPGASWESKLESLAVRR